MKNLSVRQKEICHIVVFLLILVMLISFAEQILNPKWYYNPDFHGYAYEGDTPRYEGFYKLEKNSLDFIGLGPSNVFQSINPTLIYAESGYKGYILSGSSQGMGLSYIWLKEALKYQHPKYVFLSAIAIASEAIYGKAADNVGAPSKQVTNMRPFFEKLEACFICDSEYKRWWEYFFSIESFHSRWDELSKQDFENPKQYFENGSYISFDTENFTHVYDKNRDFSLVSDLNGNTGQETRFPIREENIEYLDKIEKLCKDNEIELVIIPTVSSYRDREVDDYIEQYAHSHELDVLNINEETAGINWFTDSADTGWHLNYWGNCKASNYLSDYLIGKAGKKEISPSDKKWKSDVYDFSQYETEALLTDKDRVISYLDALSDIKDDCIILCAVLDEACEGYTEQLGDLLRELGLNGFNENYRNHVQESYISVIDAGMVLYENWYAGPMELADQLSFTNGSSQDIYIASGGFVYGNLVEIRLADKDFAVHSRGLNIVVIDKETGNVKSSIGIDSYDPKWTYTESNNFDNSWEKSPILEDGDYCINNMPVKITYVGDGAYIIENNDKFLAIPLYTNKPNVELIFDDYTGLGNQKWIICKAPNGKYTVYSLFSHYGCVTSQQNGTGLKLGDTLYTGDEFTITLH